MHVPTLAKPIAPTGGASTATVQRPGSAKPRSAEMHPGPGFRLRHEIERPDPFVVRRFLRFPTPAISDQLNRLFTMSAAIQLQTAPAHRVLGPAVTVKVFPGDNLTGGVILEVNGLPGIHYHYLVDPATNHRSVAVPILEALLDPVKGVATDTGSDGVGWEVRSGRSRVAPVHHSGV